MAGIDESIVNTSENGLETKTYLSVCVKNYGRSKTMRKRWYRLMAFNEDVSRLVEVELLSVFLNTYPDLPCSSHAPLSNLLFYWLSIACTAIVSGLGLLVCFIVFSANTRTCYKRCEPPSLRASSPTWASEASLARTPLPFEASPLARAFSRDSLLSPK